MTDATPATPPADDASVATPAEGTGSPAPAPETAVPTAVLPPENVVRGLLLALITVPLGVIAFSIIYSLGYIASIVALGVALVAYFLYRRGSGGRVSTVGALVVAGVTIGTLVLAFIVAQYVAVAVALGDVYGMSWFEVLTAPEFGSVAAEILADSEVASGIVGDAIFTAVFGLLGCGAVLFNAFRAARAEKSADGATPPVAPPAS